MIVTQNEKFKRGDSVTAAKLNNIVTTATISNVRDADIVAVAGIPDTKLGTITTANKVNTTALTVTSETTGDIIYANTTTTWARLAKGTAGTALSLQHDTYNKLMLHGDGVDLTTVTTGWDDNVSAKTVTNTAAYDTYTKLCSHFDGANGATAYTDPIAGAYTFVSGAKLSTAQKKWTSSLLLNGSSDYVTLPDSADWDFGTGDFTIDCWIYINTLGNHFHGICGQNVDINHNWRFGVHSNGAIRLDYIDGGSAIAAFATGTIAAGAWTHIVAVRSSGVIKIYQDGVYKTTTDNINTTNMSDFAVTLSVGMMGEGVNNYYLDGYIDELRISKGIARWTTDFAYPVAPYGQVVISTNKQQFGTGSLLFDGSGSYLSLADSADWDFDDAAFSIDCQVYFNVIGKIQVICGQYEDANNYWFVEIDAANKLHLKFVDGSASKGDYIMASAWSGLAISTWYHLAFVRSTTAAKIYINGVSQTLTETTAFGTNDVGDMVAALLVGQQNSISHFDGYIDELRISKGVARWTADFTAPTKAYTPLPYWVAP